MNYRLSQEIEWLGVRVRVPEDWQIVRHGLDPEMGRLVWVDRRRERFTLAWTHFGEPPDLARLVADYRSLLAREHPDARLCPLSGCPGWRGLEAKRESSQDILTRAARWDAPRSRLLEVIIFTRADVAREAALPAELTRGLVPVASPDSAQRWRAFDVDVEAPPNYRLVALKARPADTTLTFRQLDRTSQRAGGAEATLRRLGMADAWHDGDLERLLRREEPGARFERVSQAGRGPGASLMASGREPGPRWRRAIGWLRIQRSLAWECPAENAVYLLSTRSPARAPLLPTDFAVRCKERVA